MAIKSIIKEKCINCNICVQSCSLDIILEDKNSGSPMIAYPNECMMCQLCVIWCPKDAIEFTKESPVVALQGWV